MKKIFLTAALLAPLALFAQTLQNFYDKYAGHDGFTTVKISPKLFDLVASADVNDEDLSFLKDLTGINVLVWENEEGNTDATKAMELTREAFQNITTEYDELLSVKEEGTDLKILAKSASEGIVNDLLIIGNDDGEFVYVEVLGKIDIKKLSHISDDIDIKGMDELKKLDDSEDQEDKK